MVNRFQVIDLSQLPAPLLIEEVSYDAVLAAQKAWVQATYDAARLANPALPALDTLGLETEPITLVLESVAYRETLLRQLVNDKARAVLLGFATGSDLDAIAAFFGVQRLVLQPADDTVIPPIPAVMEPDDRLRRRVQLAVDAFSVAGPYGAYVYWALTTDGSVVDAHAIAPGVSGQADGRVNVYVAGANGVPVANDVIDKLVRVFQREDVAPLTDIISVIRAQPVEYDAALTLQVPRGPDPNLLVLQASNAIRAYAASRYAIGKDVFRSGVVAAAKVGGVENVVTEFADVVCDDTQIPILRTLTVLPAVIS